MKTTPEPNKKEYLTIGRLIELLSQYDNSHEVVVKEVECGNTITIRSIAAQKSISEIGEVENNAVVITTD